MLCRSAVAWQLFAFDPVTDGEMECWTVGKVYYSQSFGPFQVLFENDQGGEVAVGSEGGDFLDGEFVTVAVCGARDVSAEWEEGR